MAEENKRRYRLAILATHPIQYQIPLYRALAAHPELDVTVFFCSDWGLNSYHDEGFGQKVKWDIDLLGDYRSEFLPNRSLSPNVATFFGIINPAIVSRLRRGNFHAVLIHGWAHFSNWLAMLTAFVCKIPVLMRGDSNRARSKAAMRRADKLRSERQSAASIPEMSKRKALIKRFILTRLFKRIAGFLTIGSQNAEFYRYYGVSQDKLFLVPFAVDNDFFLSKASELANQKADLKRQLGIAKSTSVILFSGKLTGVKRPMDLLQAYEEIAKKYPAALVYLGDGALRKSLEQYASEKDLSAVYFVGFQNQTEVPRFFALADMFVLPSVSESWGLVVNEAMCFGLPVVVSDQVGAASDLVRDNVNGFIYEATNVTALAEKLDTLLSDANLQNRMGEASKAMIEQWGLPEDVQGILSCLKQVVR